MKKQSGTKRSSKKQNIVIESKISPKELAEQVGAMISRQLGGFDFFEVSGCKISDPGFWKDSKGNNVEGGLRLTLPTNPTKANRLEIIIEEESLFTMHFYSTYFDKAKSKQIVNTKTLLQKVWNTDLLKNFEEVTGLIKM